ncbi:MAG: NFACT RNA binding domain-containing protein [Oscillospiraceae bacterium]|nr:NFACT RNA binding domain-containing protein [Oscillospiraceae bacterium]
MALDGAFLSCVGAELSHLIGSRIEKIHQPSRDVLVLCFRGKMGAVKVLCSAAADAARIHITAQNIENPPQPPMFCMLMRKHLGGGKLEAVRQDGLERILMLDFRCTNELGDSVLLTLVCEMMGRCSNLILLNETGRIIDSIRRVDEDISRVRLVLPGMEYSPPPRDARLCFLTDDDHTIRCAMASATEQPLSKALIRYFEGISPIIAREWEYFAGHGAPLQLPLGEDALERLLFVIHQSRDMLLNGQCRFTTVRTKYGQLKDFAFRHIEQYGSLMITTEYPTASAALDAFFSQRDHVARMRQRANDLFRFLVNATERIRKRLAAQREELLACDTMETDRRRGDLLSANLYRLQRGDAVAVVEDFYEETAPLVRIPLDVRMTPAQNAQHYYKKYQKACTAKKMLTTRIAAGEQELAYIDSVFDALTRADCESDLAQIRLELVEQGYLKESRKAAKPPKALPPLQFHSSDGYEILVGRNNHQNDQLTLRVAEKNDYWFHTQSVHGAHVIVLAKGETPPDRTLEEAAMLAAYYSRGKDSAQVAVDYCLAKYVKKPTGSRPGMVIYTNYQTAFVTPDAALCESLRSNLDLP